MKSPFRVEAIAILAADCTKRRTRKIGPAIGHFLFGRTGGNQITAGAEELDTFTLPILRRMGRLYQGGVGRQVPPTSYA